MVPGYVEYRGPGTVHGIMAWRAEDGGERRVVADGHRLVPVITRRHGDGLVTRFGKKFRFPAKSSRPTIETVKINGRTIFPHA